MTPSTPADPLAGLDERLDRLLLTARDNERFILSTESAKNIVGIVREWLRVHSSTAAPTDAGALADRLETVMKFSSGFNDMFKIDGPLLRDIGAALRNSAPQETRGDEPAAAMLNWLEVFALEIKPFGYVKDNEAVDDFLKAARVRVTLAAPPQQSPRLEREGIAALLKIIDDLDAYQKQPGRGDYGIECACCMSELFDKRERAVIENTRALLSPDTTVVTSTDHSTVDAIAERSHGVSKGTIRNLLDAELCDDCPPRGYPTDKTRCRVSPRVSSKRHSPLMEATPAQHFDLPKGQVARFVRNGKLETCQCRDCKQVTLQHHSEVKP